MFPLVFFKVVASPVVVVSIPEVESSFLFEHENALKINAKDKISFAIFSDLPPNLNILSKILFY